MCVKETKRSRGECKVEAVGEGRDLGNTRPSVGSRINGESADTYVTVRRNQLRLGNAITSWSVDDQMISESSQALPSPSEPWSTCRSDSRWVCRAACTFILARAHLYQISSAGKSAPNRSRCDICCHLLRLHLPLMPSRTGRAVHLGPAPSYRVCGAHSHQPAIVPFDRLTSRTEAAPRGVATHRHRAGGLRV